ncbi:hypothetical protein M3Y99_00308600 [Aphelenchoides fujianensis]|nr:hypothetical protein M3Y99_00308600 [Aphelenchoides fujianensis]
MASESTLKEEDREKIANVIAGCSKSFMQKMVLGCMKFAKADRRSAINYDDVAAYIQSEPALVPLRDHFPLRVTLGEVMELRRKEAAAQWTPDYTFYNRHKEEGEEEPQPAVKPKPKAKSKANSKQRRMSGGSKKAKGGAKKRRKSSSSRSGVVKKRKKSTSK